MQTCSTHLALAQNAGWSTASARAWHVLHLTLRLPACSAVDNVLLKLAERGVPFLRLGSQRAVHPAVRAHLPGGCSYPDTSVAGLRDMSQRARVVRMRDLSTLATTA